MSAGIFTVDEILAEVLQFQDIAEPVETQFAGAPERVRFLEALRGLIDLLVSGLIDGTYAAARGIADLDEIRKSPCRLATFTATALETNAALKRFLRRKVYLSELLGVERTHSAKMISELFQFFLDHPDRLPENYAESPEPPHRIVCDYIAGMTDGYFRRIYGSCCDEADRVVVR